MVAPSAKTVASLLDEWLAHIEHLGRSPSTLFNYRRLVAQLPDGFKGLPLKNVTPKVVDDLVKARLHDLRHLQASLLLDAGEAVTTVAARLGHRDTSTTLKVYGHLMPGADSRAAGIVGSALSRRPPVEP